MSKNKQKYLRIGEISKKTGVAVSALRYYEEVGLLEPCYKSESNYRYYLDSDVLLVKFIKKSQHLGFTLEEIGDIFQERENGKSPCPKVRKLAQGKIDSLRKKVSELKKLERELKKYITEADSEINCLPDAKDICHMIDGVDL